MKHLFSFIIYSSLIVPPLIFFTDLTRNPYYFQIVLLNSLTVLLWIVWLYSGFKKKTFNLIKTTLDAPLAVFFVLASLSWVLALLLSFSDPYLSYGVLNEGLKRWLFLLVNSILVYYMAVNFVNNSNRSSYIHVIFFTAFIASFYGILQYFGIELIWPKVLSPFGGRCVSTFGNPNFLSSYLVLIIPVAYVFTILARDTIKYYLYVFLMMSFFAALLCTLTRSSLLGVFVAMTISVILIWKYERELIIGNLTKSLFIPFSLMAGTIIFWPRSRIGGYSPSLLERLNEYFDLSFFSGVSFKYIIAIIVFVTISLYSFWFFKKQRKYIFIFFGIIILLLSSFILVKGAKSRYAALDQRQLIWSCSWHMVAENPLLGKGWGCFELFYPFYQGRHLFLDKYSGLRTHANNTHNEILEIWSQTGILGFGAYLWFIITLAVSGLFLVKNLQGEKRLLAIGLLSSLAGMLADNLLNVSLHFAVPGFFYWWNAGILINLGRSETKEIDLNSNYKKLIVLILILLGGAIIFHYSRNFLGEMYYFRGFKLSKSNNVDRALLELEKAHKFQRLEVNNNYELANCYSRSGQRDKGLVAYREALRANAGYDEIYFNMATVLSQSGREEEAIFEYTRSININPASQESYNALGSIFLKTPERYADSGVILFKQSLHFFPENKDIWNNLGYLYTKSDMNNEAIEAYKRALEIAPDFELAKRNLKVSMAKLGKTDKNFEMVESLFVSVEKNVAAKNWESALSDCEKLVKLAPRSFNARFYLANIYFTVGRVKDAINEYLQAQTLDPANNALLGNLGFAYFAREQYDLASQQFQKLLQVDPGNALAKSKLDEINKILSNRR